MQTHKEGTDNLRIFADIPTWLYGCIVRNGLSADSVALQGKAAKQSFEIDIKRVSGSEE